MHFTPCALDLALARAGSNMLARIAMMAMTTSNSISVNPRRRRAAGREGAVMGADSLLFRIRRPGAVGKANLAAILAAACLAAPALEPITDQLIVLTFGDSVASHDSVARPLLKAHGFGATFFITEGFGFRTNKRDYLTWEQIAGLHRDGFEIGNHTRDHLGVSADTLGRLREQVAALGDACAAHGVP